MAPFDYAQDRLVVEDTRCGHYHDNSVVDGMQENRRDEEISARLGRGGGRQEWLAFMEFP